MAETREAIEDWLKNFKKDDLVWIDEGGLTIEGESTKGKRRQHFYYEIGGEPREEDEDA